MGETVPDVSVGPLPELPVVLPDVVIPEPEPIDPLVQ